MAVGSGITSVDDIAHDNEELEKKATDLVLVPGWPKIGVPAKTSQAQDHLVIDKNETIGKPLELVDPSVRAILIKRHGGGGAVRVHGNAVRNVVTGPDKDIGFDIVIIGTGETCRLFGTPTVRYFRRRNS
jgi:hypothetical protein